MIRNSCSHSFHGLETQPNQYVICSILRFCLFYNRSFFKRCPMWNLKKVKGRHALILYRDQSVKC
ncbi:TPA: hypothetical protein JBD37_06820 [Legionella pneumophila subsp. pneumophila]|uniref:Uncharacterized protein n=3 Tax=Legionella pneumophila TaxID=446 RepID=Q5ZWP0_LEGPH|nr:hypothetical protein lpg1045 [Legionella pneumophila subsp. pneumophila str. Philadelphia 1]AWG45544.1 hypothetical protein AXF35_15365 [Legionella pneumophila subsp. pascullei]PNL78588.1 hypothetical protein A6J41_011770 [Legionella pneumophila subsp. pneumophila]PPK26698.1 hypothetical protein C3929_12070 [Legionella pneumophila]HAT8681736.1 hypothetical protein [Legionella pneumophila subsp. pneumophila ATCC 43283]